MFLYNSCTSSEGASRGGQPNIFTWFLWAGDRSRPGVLTTRLVQWLSLVPATHAWERKEERQHHYPWISFQTPFSNLKKAGTLKESSNVWVPIVLDHEACHCKTLTMTSTSSSRSRATFRDSLLDFKLLICFTTSQEETFRKSESDGQLWIHPSQIRYSQLGSQSCEVASVLHFRGPDDTLLWRRHKSHGPPASESQKKVRESPGLDCDVARDMSIERDALAPRPQHVGSLTTSNLSNQRHWGPLICQWMIQVQSRFLSCMLHCGTIVHDSRHTQNSGKTSVKWCCTMTPSSRSPMMWPRERGATHLLVALRVAECMSCHERDRCSYWDHNLRSGISLSSWLHKGFRNAGDVEWAAEWKSRARLSSPSFSFSRLFWVSTPAQKSCHVIWLTNLQTYPQSKGTCGKKRCNFFSKLETHAFEGRVQTAGVLEAGAGIHVCVVL